MCRQWFLFCRFLWRLRWPRWFFPDDNLTSFWSASVKAWPWRMPSMWRAEFLAPSSIRPSMWPSRCWGRCDGSTPSSTVSRSISGPSRRPWWFTQTFTVRWRLEGRTEERNVFFITNKLEEMLLSDLLCSEAQETYDSGTRVALGANGTASIYTTFPGNHRKPL